MFHGSEHEEFFAMEKVLDHAKTRESRTAQSNTPDINALTRGGGGAGGGGAG